MYEAAQGMYKRPAKAKAMKASAMKSMKAMKAMK